MFCPKCSSILVPKKGKSGKRYLYCQKCDKRFYHEEGKITEVSGEKKDRIIIVSDAEEKLPITTTKCSKCNNNKAYYWVVQTRAADEAPTKFLKCTKCGNRWRDYG